MRNTNVTTEVTKYIKARPNEVVTADEIAQETGLTNEQIRYAMRRLSEKTTLGRYITIINRGNTWEIGAIPGARRSRPVEIKTEEEPEEKIVDARDNGIRFVPIGVLRDGAHAVRDADGKLWKMEAL